ncbi:diguanylate cyclase [Microvirga tunisiensis]|uniref:Diguanylate cyclase n=2 Tax=Pannonibacter tanglangensis TaxID=2750084 RepID=A0ABW9ZCU8_9HYPH|nr:MULTISPECIES: diguanylate cyclase [unclassified Pannonibacter]NBN62665.1 diguanylate cyclase [Pannonibacter sp. XCT-34]NBN78320.1 diguanylate cyclase [Pannonibacter sp. XCT-53]
MDTGPALHRQRWTLRHQVYLLAAVLITLATLSLVFVGFIASRAADEQAKRNELRLLENALTDRSQLIARDQFTLARWDRAVENISVRFNSGFVRYEFFDALWYDFGHEHSFLVNPSGVLLAEQLLGEASFRRKPLEASSPLMQIAQATANRYAETGATLEAPGTLAATKVEESSVFAFADLDGVPTLLVAMPIVPDDHTVDMPAGPPTVLVSARSLDEAFVADLNAQLSFEDLRFVTAIPGDEIRTVLPINRPDGTQLGSFRWISETPGQHVWQMIIPAIVFLGSLIAVSALVIAWKISGLTRALETREREASHLAQHDMLTGLANRLQVSTALAAAVSALPDRRFALISCDLDRFKDINDNHGHGAGDEVLRVVARRLEAAVGTAGLVGRLGGDEFIVLVTAFSDRRRLTRLAQEILVAVPAPVLVNPGVAVQFGVSLGIAVAEEAADAEDLLAAADAALYAAKARRTGSFVFAGDPDTDALKAAADRARGGTGGQGTSGTSHSDAQRQSRQSLHIG